MQPCDMDQSQFNLQFTNGHLGEESPAQNPTVKTIIHNILPFFGKKCGLSQQFEKRNECEMNIKPYLHCFDSFCDLFGVIRIFSCILWFASTFCSVLFLCLVLLPVHIALG